MALITSTFMTYKGYIYKLRDNSVYAVKRDSMEPKEVIESASNVGYLDINDKHNDYVLMVYNGIIVRVNSSWYNSLVNAFRTGRSGFAYKPIADGIVEVTYDDTIKGMRIDSDYKVRDMKRLTEETLKRESEQQNQKQDVDDGDRKESSNLRTFYFTADKKHVYKINDNKLSRFDLNINDIQKYKDSDEDLGFLSPYTDRFALVMRGNAVHWIKYRDFIMAQDEGIVKPTEFGEVFEISLDFWQDTRITKYGYFKDGSDELPLGSTITCQFTMDNTHIYHMSGGLVDREPLQFPISHFDMIDVGTGYLDDSKKWVLKMYAGIITRISRDDFMKIKSVGESKATDIPGVISITYDYQSLPRFSEYTQYKFVDRETNVAKNSNERRRVRQEEGTTKQDSQQMEGNNLGLINKTVTRMFTLDSKNVYKVVNGIVVREPIGDLSQYANTGPEVGYLDQSNQWALMVNNGKIVRIKRDKFMDIKAAGSTEVDPQMPGLLTITYDTAKVPDNTLGVSTQYKLADKKGGDFDNIPNPVQSVSSQPNNTATESKSQKPDDTIPDLVQDLAKQNLGRTITEVDISLFRQLLDAIDTNNGIIRPNELKKEEDQTLRGFINSGHVLFSSQNQIFTIAVPNPLVLNCMRRAVEMYDGAQLVNGGKQPDPIHVVAAAMNMAKEDRERIGLVNQGTPVQQNVDTGSGRRFGSSAKTGGDGSVSVGSLHRPRALSSSTVFPFDVPCVVRKTAPYYTMLTMHKPFIEYTKPIESFLTANITIDKRIPMRVVPMVTDDKHGYAYPKKVKSEEKVVSDKCIPVATREPGIYWMFYEMKRAVDIETQEFQFICNILIEYINSNSMSFDLSKSGVVAGVASSVSTAIDEIGYDTSNKQEAIDVYRKFFEETGKGLFRPMKVSYKSGFVIAMTRGNTQVLLTSVIINNSNVEWSQYPEHITIIPIGGEFGLLIVGAEPSDISDIERVMSRVETIEDEEGEYDQPDD